MIVLASEEPILVVLDPDDELSLQDVQTRLLNTASSGTNGASYQPHTAVRVTRSDYHPEGPQALAEDIAATWFVDFITLHQTVAPTSGHGVRAAVRALTQSGLLTTQDRRDAIPVGTRWGVRDVLLGRAGMACDLGRWRMASTTDPDTWVVTIAGTEWSVVSTDDLDGWGAGASFGTYPERCAIIAPGLARTSEGIGLADTRIVVRGEDRRSSGTGAAAAALILRHLLPADAPHHWAVGYSGGAEGTLAVRMFPTEEGEHVSISGPVEVLN